MKEPLNLLAIIADSDIHPLFGSNIAQALESTFGNEARPRSYRAAGVICSLFLSVMLEKLPSAILNSYVHNIKESCSLFSFDCKSYEAIYQAMKEKKTILLCSNGEQKEVLIDKNTFFEALDFITNI